MEFSYSGGAGGFMASSPNPFGGNQDAKKSGHLSLRPLTIRHLLSATQPISDGPYTLDGTDLSTVCIIGRINSRTRANTLNLIVDDGTGAIEVRKWVTEGDESDESPELQEGFYVKIHGNYKTYSNSHYISLLSAKLVESPDEITYHMLHAIHSHLHLSNGLPNAKTSYAMPGSNHYQESPFIHGASQPNNGLTRIQNEIMNIIEQAADTSEGASVPDIIRRMRGMASEGEVREALDWLQNEAHIYNTIDEDHVQKAG